MDTDFNKKLEEQKDKILDLITDVVLERAEKRIKDNNDNLDLKTIIDQEINKALNEIKNIDQK